MKLGGQLANCGSGLKVGATFAFKRHSVAQTTRACVANSIKRKQPFSAVRSNATNGDNLLSIRQIGFSGPEVRKVCEVQADGIVRLWGNM